MPLEVDELRKMDLKQLKERLNELEMQLLKLRVESRMGTLKNTASIKNTRKDIARILTVIGEKSKKEAKK
ncbi:50S ribosomal protein L29 [Sulfolobus acidocaldarius]|uniref:Large ribosomal subunit protein uL29 n=5 Tax=Sulfolobus acidocaldarius TaxID=2285 RepID=RL29_SULAC|nr:50S ribosomal protein L29 [Sulfolobus acidocaldarius]Q4JB47.1 RecName: Full=Large ribosomal subunit protein uL29; AltName: Full=50S ribosomal protein L29 [Sulfolobus acidocaldarius DSM 639]AHC50996.1 50S ribosomal protein L29 [Sulfolobus acidocaldarius SUSAZ]AAY79982.1 50S ribosomal protein L29P [Sulfolobus acidocaldarius DSM 639]AGE70551.1 50S ribosomal protein L29P [Sulfolobus acidocaldarius N8]AGE72824.1 50S ribosomal protein L29P [Sulfolobus acidocaldarius Ron12/I]ALU29090.1 50S riboso